MGNNTSKYKNLKINLDEIPAIINSWGVGSEYSNVSVELPKDMTAQSLNYKVYCDGKEALVAVYPTKGGVCTISPNFGREKNISTQIADFIVMNCGNLADSNPYRNGLSIKIAQNEFNAFYELMKEQEDVVVERERTEEHKFMVRFHNKRYKDTIVVSYYSTGKMVIQGKPLELFSLAIEILSNDNGLDKVINAETKSAGLTVNSNDIIEDMTKSLGNAYEFLGTSHKAILASAYIFYRTNIVVIGEKMTMDYSVLFHPASRALEAYILKLLVHNNILRDNGEGIGYYFRSEDDNKPLTLHGQFEAAVNNDIIVCEINRLYKLFYRLRHPYSHAAENDYTTSIITNREKADYHFNEIIEAINKSYDVITSAKK